MINLLKVNLKEDGILDVSINGELIYLFEKKEDLINLVDIEALRKSLLPLLDNIIAKAKGCDSDV